MGRSTACTLQDASRNPDVIANAPASWTAVALHRFPRSAAILWHLLKFKQPFNPEVFAKEEAKMKRKKLQRLEAMATTLN